MGRRQADVILNLQDPLFRAWKSGRAASFGSVFIRVHPWLTISSVCMVPVKSAVGLGVVSTLPGCSTISAPHDPASAHAIHRENARPGTRDWLLTKTRIDAKTKYRSPWIEGYCSRATVKAGEEISFHVSTNPSSSFTLDVFRMGYYGGTGGRHFRAARICAPFRLYVTPGPGSTCATNHRQRAKPDARRHDRINLHRLGHSQNSSGQHPSEFSNRL